MKQPYSIFTLARNALTHHEDWTEAWRSPDPKPAYDVVIIGGGGHGLATAYYLAKHHGITNVAVLERGWLAGGNVARNTTVIRSNYLWDESTAIYEHALRLWEGLSEELDYDLLFSQRGVINLAHNLHDVREGIRRHRDSSGQELCWHHPALWNLLPEKTDPLPTVPAWPEFLRGCVRYRESLDRQLPTAPRTQEELPG